VNKLLLITTIAITVLFLVQCQQVEENGNGNENKLPVLVSISPVSKVSHQPSFTLTASGTNFKVDSAIVFDGTEKITAYVSDTQLTCQVEPDDILASAAVSNFNGSRVNANRTVSVHVHTPSISENEGNTAGFEFTIYDTHQFNAAVPVSEEAPDVREPAIVTDREGGVYIIWEEKRSLFPGIYFCRSVDGGASWSSPGVLSGNGDFRHPDIAIDSAGNLNAVWYDNDNNARDIYFRRSIDGGQTWSEAKNISVTLRGSFDPAITVDGSGNLYVVWVDDTPGKRAIAFTRSGDNGNSWSPAVNISNIPDVSDNPAIAAGDSGHVYVVWSNGDNNTWKLYFNRSVNSGTTWEFARKMIDLDNPYSSPDLAVDSRENVYLAFDNIAGFTGYIYLTRSTDYGLTWEPLRNISAILQGRHSHWQPVIAVDRTDNVNLVWGGDTDTIETIYFSRSIDGGLNWAPFETNSDFLSINGISASVDYNGDLHIAGVNYIFSSSRFRLYYSRSGSSN
jgi:hypothetical protein